MTVHDEAEFRGKRVLITGGTKGMGGATARRFARAGAQVLVVARSAPQNDLPATFIPADLSTEQGVADLGRRVLDEVDGIDVLINNAGAASELAATLETPEATWRETLDINLMSSVRLDRVLVPGMVERGNGVVVHVSSVLSRQPRTGQASYAAAKAALNVYSRQLATDDGPRGVRVVTVVPGFIATEGAMAFMQKTADDQGIDLEQLQAGMADELGPMGRAGDPDDVAEMILFLASSKAGFLTGAQFRVDGGYIDAV